MPGMLPMGVDLMILICGPAGVSRMTGVARLIRVTGSVPCFGESGVGVCLGHSLAVGGVGVIAAVGCSFCDGGRGGGRAGGTGESLVVRVFRRRFRGGCP